MGLVSLQVENIRCFSDFSLSDLSSGINLFTGKNGSGKSSLLEAIHILGLGRSFRCQQASSVIRYEQSSLSISGVIQRENDILTSLGVRKNNDNSSNLRINHKPERSLSALADLLPIQALHPQSTELILGPSKNRRQFCDWGVFHWDPTFYEDWKKANILLKQRNILLKKSVAYEECEVWDDAYIKACEAVSLKRAAYCEALYPYAKKMLSVFARLPEVSLSFKKGWSHEGDSLESSLRKNYSRDCRLGYTSLGSHRDDLLISAQGCLIADTLSRGEQKLVVAALRLAQGQFLREACQKNSVFLLDDFSSELDPEHRRLMLSILAEMDSQSFVTGIEINEVKPAFDLLDGSISVQMFHVEHGQIRSNSLGKRL